ncbi:hypothetical protein C1645_831239 [Glomus cerebriforme]|uniref:HCP-like protein n=1 Tax=Glomus cerebriforme TaxID=658196 RepID=A0A397SKF5_9GLOM|nr:hypothetical protein C1645_831239 [Glomus cerebriforme]
MKIGDKNKKLSPTYQLLNIIIAKYLLSFYYYKDVLYKRITTEFGKEENEFKAFELYLRFVEEGNVRAQNNLGYCYQNEIGITKDEKKASEWYLKATNEGGNCYQNEIGVEKDLEKLFTAAENGDGNAQYCLGECYELGIGVYFNERRAFEFYKKSADQGFIDAQYKLGYIYTTLYEQGKGTEKSIEDAIYWYKKAMANGCQLAGKKLKYVK